MGQGGGWGWSLDPTITRESTMRHGTSREAMAVALAARATELECAQAAVRRRREQR